MNEDKKALREALKFMLMLEEQGVTDICTPEEFKNYRRVVLIVKKRLTKTFRRKGEPRQIK